MAEDRLHFRVSAGQMIGDALAGLLMCVLGYFFITMFFFAAFTIIADSNSPALAVFGALVCSTVLMFVLLWRMDLTWWWITLHDNELALKTIRTRRIAYQEIILIHAGLEVGMQNDGERKSAVDLTIEAQHGRKYKIHLKHEHAQACIAYVTQHSACTGGIAIDGTEILPSEASAVAEVKLRIGHKYLRAAIAGLGVGLPCLALFLFNIRTLFDGDNPFKVIVALLALASILGYGFWALGKYKALKKEAK